MGIRCSDHHRVCHLHVGRSSAISQADGASESRPLVSLSPSPAKPKFSKHPESAESPRKANAELQDYDSLDALPVWPSALVRVGFLRPLPPSVQHFLELH